MESQECKVVYVDGLDTDWRVVGANVVNWDKYKKAKEDEERWKNIIYFIKQKTK